MHCADTSFLLSYYGEDAKSEAARTAITSSSATLHVHALNEFELSNAMRALAFRGEITQERKTFWLADYQSDKEQGVLIEAIIDANAVFRHAEIISATSTETTGNRAYDILLVAAAKLLGATHFWTFDSRQRELARAEGLLVCP